MANKYYLAALILTVFMAAAGRTGFAQNKTATASSRDEARLVILKERVDEIEAAMKRIKKLAAASNPDRVQLSQALLGKRSSADQFAARPKQIARSSPCPPQEPALPGPRRQQDQTRKAPQRGARSAADAPNLCIDSDE